MTKVRPNGNSKELALWCNVFLIQLLPSLLRSYWYVEDVLLSMLVGCIVSAAFASVVVCFPWRGVRWVVFTVLLGVSLFELAHMLVYNGDTASAGYVRSLFMTTPYEADGALWRVIRQHIVFIALLATTCILVSIQIFVTSPANRLSRWALPVSALMVAGGMLFRHDAFVSRPPINIYVQMAEACRQSGERESLVPQGERFCYHARRMQKPANEKREVYVLLIGESLRYDHISIGGVYSRPTMPMIEQLPNAVSYTDYYTTGVFTMYAVPMLITRAEPETFASHYSERGVQQAFAETGFKTLWLTNEAQIVSDGVSHYMARGAEIVKAKHDMDIPQLLDSVLQETDSSLFVIINLWGNHQFYWNSQTAAARYYPDITTTKAVHGEEMYVNSYDNAILCTDSVIAAITSCLQRKDIIAQWIFTSDHGEGPIGNNGGAHGYTCPTSGEYHVPLMVWYSDEYKEAYPEKVANVIKHKDEPVCADHVFWSVLDMADIRIDSTLQQDGMSVFGDTLLPHRRTLLLPDGRSVLTLD